MEWALLKVGDKVKLNKLALNYFNVEKYFIGAIPNKFTVFNIRVEGECSENNPYCECTRYIDVANERGEILKDLVLSELDIIELKGA
tara:strand:+ start:685 stop:945 length:261 start_codon:yes stop_codon:yes gene_type:complete